MEFTAEEEAYFATGEMPDGDKDAASVEEDDDTHGADEEDTSNEAEGAEHEEGEGEEDTDADAEKTEGEEEEGEATKTVPLKALQAERARRQELQERARKLESRIDQVLQYVADKKQQQEQSQQVEEEPAPDPEEDIFGAYEHLSKRVEQQDAYLRQQQAEAEERASLNVFRSNLQVLEAQYAQEYPDYYESAAFLKESIAAEIDFYGVPPAEKESILRNQLIGITLSAAERNQNPAHVIASMARHRGFVPKSARKEQAQSSAEADAQRRAKGSKSSKTLATTGGKSGGGRMTAQAFMDLSPEKAAEWLEKNGEAAFEKLLVGE